VVFQTTQLVQPWLSPKGFAVTNNNLARALHNDRKQKRWTRPRERESLMLKHVLLGALLLVVPACATQDHSTIPAPAPPGKVLIIGDSIALGLGAMGPNTDCPLTPEFNTLRNSFGVQIADELGVGYEIFAWPGIGLVRNYGTDQTNTMSNRLSRRDEIKRLDAAKPVQLVLVNLGTHDFFERDPSEAFEPAMEDLLTMLSARYPDATIYALTGPMLHGLDDALHDKAVHQAVDAVNAAKGTHIRYLALDGGDEAVAHGCRWHPSVPAHDHMAEIILQDMKAHE